jgi:hypothetical protein
MMKDGTHRGCRHAGAAPAKLLWTVQGLAEYMVLVDENRKEIRALQAAGERCTSGVDSHYLPALINFAYNEVEQLYNQPEPWHDRKPEKGCYPQQLVLEILFDAFLDHLDEKDVRTLFARFGPKPPRVESKQREEYLVLLYLSEGNLHKGLPNKAQFAQKIADFNKTVPREKRLGSRSTNQANVLRYLERALAAHPEEHDGIVEQARAFAHDFASHGWKLKVPAPEMPVTNDQLKGQFRRKTSRQK